MRHRRRAKYFGVKTAHRKAMFRNMATSLFRHGRITTTVTRAKELRRIADKLVTLAKEGSLHSRRQALSFIMDKTVVAKLFSEIAPLMAERRGGYTRIVKIGPRRGDGAMMCVIELVRESIGSSKAKSKKEISEEQVAPTVIPEAQETQKSVDEAAESTESELQTKEETDAEATSQKSSESLEKEEGSQDDDVQENSLDDSDESTSPDAQDAEEDKPVAEAQSEENVTELTKNQATDEQKDGKQEE